MDATTGADGKAVFKDLEQGKYSYQEISAPSGYVVDKTKYQITITATTLNIAQKRTNTPAKASIEIVKVDGDNKTPLQGAGFRLYDASNKQVAEGYTDVNGKLTFPVCDWAAIPTRSSKRRTDTFWTARRTLLC